MLLFILYIVVGFCQWRSVMLCNSASFFPRHQLLNCIIVLKTFGLTLHCLNVITFSFDGQASFKLIQIQDYYHEFSDTLSLKKWCIFIFRGFCLLVFLVKLLAWCRHAFFVYCSYYLVMVGHSAIAVKFYCIQKLLLSGDFLHLLISCSFSSILYVFGSFPFLKHLMSFIPD